MLQIAEFSLVLLLIFLLAVRAQRSTIGFVSAINKLPSVPWIKKFDTPAVSRNAGIRGAAIPDHHIKIGKLHIPIIINYYYSGFRVNYAPSTFGISWASNANGIISRNLPEWPSANENS